MCVCVRARVCVCVCFFGGGYGLRLPCNKDTGILKALLRFMVTPYVAQQPCSGHIPHIAMITFSFILPLRNAPVITKYYSVGSETVAIGHASPTAVTKGGVSTLTKSESSNPKHHTIY